MGRSARVLHTGDRGGRGSRQLRAPGHYLPQPGDPLLRDRPMGRVSPAPDARARDHQGDPADLAGRPGQHSAGHPQVAAA